MTAPASLALVDGRALLTIERRDLAPEVAGRIEIEWPTITALPAAGAADGLRYRRGRLRSATLFVGGARLAERAANATLPAGAITRLDVTLDKGRISVIGRAQAGGRTAEFSGRLAVGAGNGRSLRVAVEDLRVNDAPPLPVSVLAAAVLAALSGDEPPREVAADRGVEVEIDLLAPALDEMLVAEGWRLPDSADLRLSKVAVGAKGVQLTWAAQPAALLADGTAANGSASEVPLADEVTSLRRSIDLAASLGEKAELAQRLAAACERAGDPTGAIAALRICLDNAPAGPLVGPAWRRLIELYARAGDPHAAARALISSADDPRTGATDAERAGTLVAAAEILRRRLGLRDDAGMLLERARALDPDSVEALEGLEAVASEAGDFARLAEVLERKIDVVARGPVEKKELLVRLADLYDTQLGRPDRARLTHERALRIDPDFAPSRMWLGRDAWARGDAAAAARDIARALETAPGETATIDLLAADDTLAAAVAVERARHRLAGTGGPAAALAILRGVSPMALSDEGLALRADLGQRERRVDDALPALEELRARAHAAGHVTDELDARIRALSGRGGDSPVPTIEELERQLTSDPGDPATAEALAGRYSALADPARRAEALTRLLDRAPGLPPERRKALYAVLGQSAEAGGDLERAEQAYWRAAQIEAEPGLRANYLTSHARLLLARGEISRATSELETALALAPQHAGALALVADLYFRRQDWSRARQLYEVLEAAPDAADVINRSELVQRRAVLAQRAGDIREGESLFRELAILNPLHADARRALAELARVRGDLGTAAQRLEEVLRLLPQGALSDLADVRQRLGAIYAEMGEWTLARTTLELVLAHDPSRAPALEILIDAYEQLEMPEAAAEACGRLSRVTGEPGRRAAALYRQAEILRTRLGDPEAALDAYLRSSDLDPAFLPARLRLVDHFWRQGDLDVVADLADDLRHVEISPSEDPDLLVRLSIARSSQRFDRSAPSPVAAHSALASAAARALADSAGRQQELETRGVDSLDPLLGRARAWAGSGEPALVRALVDLLLEDPTRPGPAIALGRLAELAGRKALAGAAYALPAFVSPGGSAARQLAALVPPGLVRPEAVRIGGPVDHPDFGGPARRALARLAPALLGFETESAAPKPTDGSGLAPARAAELRRLGDLLGAPPFVVAPDSVDADTVEDRRRLRVVLTQPAGLLVASGAAPLADPAWSFIAARALETLRSGLWMAGLAGAEGLARLLEAARAVLADSTVDEPRARAIADWLRRPDAAVFLGPPEERVETLAAVEAALATLPDWTTLTRGAQHTRNRMGLIGCADPSAALVMLKAEDRAATSAGDSPAARREFLRRAAGGDLLRFMFSPTYEATFT